MQRAQATDYTRWKKSIPRRRFPPQDRDESQPCSETNLPPFAASFGLFDDKNLVGLSGWYEFQAEVVEQPSPGFFEFLHRRDAETLGNVQIVISSQPGLIDHGHSQIHFESLGQMG